MGLLSPRGSQITTTTVAGTGSCDDHDARAMLACVEFFFCFFFDQGIGSRSAAWASRVDVVWVSVCVSSIVGCCSYVRWCCIRVALYAFCTYPHLLCNVDVMICMLLCDMASVSQLCSSFPYSLHGLCEDYLTCDTAFNAVMPLSHALTRGRYSRIEGVTSW